MRRLSAFVLTGALAISACSSSSGTKGGAANPTTPPIPATTTTTAPRPAHYGYAEREDTIVDKSRPTAANKGYPGAPDRTIRVKYYFPTEKGDDPATAGAPFPLIIWSHGWTAGPEVYQNLERAFASAGFVVAAPAYPLSNSASPGGPVVTDLGNQPADASFVLDHVLALTKSGWLEGVVDPVKIGAGGHSLGGFTTYELVYNSACRDDRVKAAVVMSAIAAGCSGTNFKNIDTPLLAVHGDHDELVPYDGGQKSFAEAHSPKFFMTFLGGKHVTEELGGTTPGQRALTKAIIGFFNRYLRGEASGLEQLKAAATQPGLTTLDAQP
jgi:predicted dienelactone hydrolase